MRKSIIIVDDDDNIRQNYQEILEEEGYDVCSFGESETALVALEKKKVHLAILDISLYGNRGAGHTLCTKIKAMYPSVHVAMITCYNNADNHRIARENGAVGCWIKHPDTSVFITNVVDILEGLE